jgi:hypothetical protein
MTKEDILKVLFAAIVAALIKPLIEAFMPSKDQLKVYIKRTVSFISAFLLPIGILTKSFLDDSPIDKYFIFKVLIFSMILILNIGSVIFEKLTSYNRSQREDIIASFEIIINGFSKITNEHVDVSREHFSVTKKSIESNEEFRDKTAEMLLTLSDRLNALDTSKRKSSS